MEMPAGLGRGNIVVLALLASLLHSIAAQLPHAHIASIRGSRQLQQAQADTTQFPYLACDSRPVVSPYRLSFDSLVANGDGSTQYCYSIVEVPSTQCANNTGISPCCRMDVGRIHFDIDPSCGRASVRGASVNGRAKSIQVLPTALGRSVFVFPALALPAASAAGTRLCFTLWNNCPTLDSFCSLKAGNICRYAVISAGSGSCCPTSNTANSPGRAATPPPLAPSPPSPSPPALPSPPPPLLPACHVEVALSSPGSNYDQLLCDQLAVFFTDSYLDGVLVAVPFTCESFYPERVFLSGAVASQGDHDNLFANFENAGLANVALAIFNAPAFTPSPLPPPSPPLTPTPSPSTPSFPSSTPTLSTTSSTLSSSLPTPTPTLTSSPTSSPTSFPSSTTALSSTSSTLASSLPAPTASLTSSPPSSPSSFPSSTPTLSTPTSTLSSSLPPPTPSLASSPPTSPSSFPSSTPTLSITTSTLASSLPAPTPSLASSTPSSPSSFPSSPPPLPHLLHPLLLLPHRPLLLHPHLVLRPPLPPPPPPPPSPPPPPTPPTLSPSLTSSTPSLTSSPTPFTSSPTSLSSSPTSLASSPTSLSSPSATFSSTTPTISASATTFPTTPS
ncbi:Pherophorin-domain-containing protein [Haematococcus lacustris]